MSIFFQEDEKLFTIHTKHSTYQMKVDEYGYLLHLYYGRKAEGSMEYVLSYRDTGFSGNPYEADKRRDYSLDFLPQEYPSCGTGDYRSTALIIRNENGTEACDLRFIGYRILPGKYDLEGLPAVYAQEQEAQTLEIRMEDPVSHLCVDLLYGVLPELDIITRAERIHHHSEEVFMIEKAQSTCLDFIAGDYDAITFYGGHAFERNMQRKSVAHGVFSIESRRGTSSHQYNPMLILADPQTTEQHGPCYAMSFVYSGCFKAEIEKDQLNGTRALMGLNDYMFEYPLSKDQIFYTPEVIMTYSGEGLASLSHNLHDCIREHVVRGPYKMASRPVLLNSWEGFYFDFNGENIYRLAQDAKELGMDMIVLDDGWYGQRDNDYAGLGDWIVNEEKLGESLESLISRVRELGIKFGIWFEPECVNEDSELYRQHPDWVLKIPGRDPVRSRYQLVLDFSRPEVVDAVFDAVCKVLDMGEISYLKWDMNRSLYDIYSDGALWQGMVLYDYVLGLYRFLEQLHQRYPDLLIEGCSGGGGRFDAGMMFYTPQIWCSDNTDPLDRIRIQYGTSFGYPVDTMASHVSTSPNHQTGRNTPLRTRSVVAMGGTYGFELDTAKLTAEEKEEIRGEIDLFHKYEPLIHNGQYYRLSDPFRENLAAWMMISRNKEEILLSAVCQQIHAPIMRHFVKLAGLPSGEKYVEEATGRLYSSDALMEIGYPLEMELKDYNTFQIYLKKIKQEEA